MKINTNVIGLIASRNLREGQRSLDASLEKIASGRRINRAADDAAGMTIADSLASQARGMGQAIRNATDAISMAQIADGALAESSNIIQTIREKAIQSASDGQSSQSRQAIQTDISNLLSQLDTIAGTTAYNGQKLLSGEFVNKDFQVGSQGNETISVSIDSTSSNQLGGSDSGRLSDIDVTTQEGAQAAIALTDQALATVNETRSQLGSTQNQLESTIRNLSASQINVYASESTIRDTDYAEESVVLSKMKLLNRARTFALAQANAQSKNMLDLLKG